MAGCGLSPPTSCCRARASCPPMQRTETSRVAQGQMEYQGWLVRVTDHCDRVTCFLSRAEESRLLLWPLHHVINLWLSRGVSIPAETCHHPSLGRHLVCFHAIGCLLIFPFRGSLLLAGGATTAQKQGGGRE